MRKVRITESQLKGLVKRMIREEMEGSKKIYGIERNGQPYDFGPYTYEDALRTAKECQMEDGGRGNRYEPRLYNSMLDELPAIERMGMPRIDKNGNLYDTDTRGFSSGDLSDY